jgi:hypothetical protein
LCENSSRPNLWKPFDSHYPTFSLEQVYGAITFYLGNRKEVEKDIAERGSKCWRDEADR